MTSLTVVVPTFERPLALAACLNSLHLQRRAPDVVVVVATSADREATAVAARTLPSSVVVTVDEPGVIAAMLAGARATHTDLVGFTDDDAIAPPDWTERIVSAFDADPLLGGYGGRDVLEDHDGVPRIETLTDDVGQLSWFGRHTGNHHRGTGTVRDVHFLKGVNATYRREALALPSGLHGTGAQAHFEVAVGRYARAQGWRLRYDPTLQVRHRPAQRHGDDQRDAPTASAVADASYNLVVAIGGAQGVARVGYAVLVGDRGSPGFARTLVALVRGERELAHRFGPSVRGTLAGGAALVRGRGVAYETAV